MNRPLLNRRCPRRPIAARAFTLVELVTAASLMTVMMMGVVQIFAIVTQTAADAQGLHFAQEQARALFDVLHRDIRGLTREGYIKIVKNPVNWGTPVASYSADTLAFTSVGCWENTRQLGQPPVQATAAEVVYTSNVRTPDQFLQVKVGSTTTVVDPRRGMLARGVWQITDKQGGSPADGTDLNDRSAAQILAELTTTGPAYVKILPLSPVSYDTTLAWTLRRVMASCVSEFYVEYLDMPSTGAVGTWKAESRTVMGGGGSTGTGGSIRAIRVTVAIHDPDDRKPLVPSTTSGVVNRFQGYALQEVFWLGDP